ncbi:hypothetical protein V6N13_125486 [Hibiscus sabdariffa]
MSQHVPPPSFVKLNFDASYKQGERGGNKVAHELARERFSLPADQIWVEEAPARIEALRAEDRRLSDPP